MSNFNGYELPVYLVKGVYTSGHIADIGPLQLAIIDRKTNSVATATGNGKEFYLAGGSMHTKDQLTKWYGGMKQSKKSEIFKGRDILSFQKATPGRPQSEQWVVGYDGSMSSATLKYEAGKQYYLKIRLYGEPVYKLWNGDIERLIGLNTGCVAGSDDCTTGCDAPAYIGAKTQTLAWVKAINSNPDLREFGIKAYPVFSDYSTTATTATVNGTGTAATFSVTTSNGKVTGISVLTPGAYTAAPTTVSIVGAGTGATATVQTTGTSPNITVTGITVTAPGSGYASTVSVRKYILKVVDSGDASALQTIQRFYPNTYNIDRQVYSRGMSTYITDYLSAAPADFQPKTLTYAPDCGACLGSDTLVPQFDIYQVRRQLASSTDLDDATARTNYAAQIVTDYSGVSGSGLYEGIINGEAVVSFKKTFGATVAALNSDIVERTGSTSAYCTPAAPATIAWVSDATGYVASRTLSITIPNEDCNNAVTLAKIQSILSSTYGIASSNVTDITDNSGGGVNQDNCVKVFQAIQTSHVMHDQYCMTSDTATFDALPSYGGSAWQETTATETYDATLKVGIRIVAPFVSQRFGIDSFDVNEYYDIAPTQMEVSLWQDIVTPCEFNTLVKARRTVGPKYSRLSGDFVVREYINRNRAYFVYEEWANDPRGREVIDNTVLQQINPANYYVAYYFKYKSKKDDTNHHQAGEVFESVFYVAESDTATQQALENALTAVSAKFGVGLENRGV